MNSITKIIEEIIKVGFKKAGYNEKYGVVSISNRPDLCQYQCNGAMMAAKEYKKAPFIIADEVVANCKDCEEFEKSNKVIFPKGYNLCKRYYEIQKDFFIEAITSSEEEACKLILRKNNAL